jgi:spectinomycin phosphotransferase
MKTGSAAMLERPDLPDETILACLAEQYALPAASVEFLPLGYDSAAGVFRVTAGGGRYFLKATTRPVDAARLRIPRYLKDQGLAQAVAPLPTTVGKLWAQADGFSLILYPYVEAAAAMEVGLADAQWVAYGTLLKRLHSLRLPPELAGHLPRESFLPETPPNCQEVILAIPQHIAGRTFADPYARRLAEFWQAHAGEIAGLVARAGELGRRLRIRPHDLVLCHADIHTANLLAGADGRLYVVDWDETVLAPKERDLMFVTGPVIDEQVGPRQVALILQGYGETEIDWLALTYYRYAWAVQDIGSFAESIFWPITGGEETTRDALRLLMGMFAPGRIVELARTLDKEKLDGG